VVLLIRVIFYVTYLLMFSMTVVRWCVVWNIGSFIIPCNGQNLCETVATAVGESWNLGLVSVTRWSDLFCKRFVRRALCYTAQCFIDLSRRFRKDCRTGCVTDFTVHQDLVMDTIVYLVSYDGLLVKNDYTQNCHVVSLFALLLCLIKNKKI